MFESKIGAVGQVFITGGLKATIEQNEDARREVMRALSRYLSGDWGDLGDSDKELNNNAVADPGSDRILARYNLQCGDIYIITEWDRSYTTLLYCRDY